MRKIASAFAWFILFVFFQQSAFSQEASSLQLNLQKAQELLQDGKATEEQLRALVLFFESQKPLDEWKLAQARVQLAKNLKEQNNISAAKELALLALEVEERLLGAGSSQCAPTLAVLGDIYLIDCQTNLNAESITRLEEILTKLSRANRAQAADYRVRLAGLYLSIDNAAEATKQWYQCIDMLRDNLPADGKDLADQCQAIFGIFISKKNFAGAQSLAQEMAQYGFDADICVSTANGFTVLSQQWQSFGKEKRAYRLAKRAIEIAEKYGGKKSCSYNGALRQSASVLRQLGKPNKALEQEEEAAHLLN